VPGNVQERFTAPPVPAAEAADVVLDVAKYGLSVPTSVAVKPVTACGFKKSFADSENLPACFDIFQSPILYADKSPKTNHVFAATFIAVATDPTALNLSPGVFIIVTPVPAANAAPVPFA